MTQTTSCYVVMVFCANGRSYFVRKDNYAMSNEPHDKTRCDTLDEAHGLLDGFAMQRCRWAVGSQATKLAILQLAPTIVYEVDYKDTASYPGKIK